MGAIDAGAERAHRRQSIERSVDGSVEPIGSVRLADLSADAVANWSAPNERVMARTTASIALLTLYQVLRFAVRRGWTLLDAVTLLEPAEKPRWRPCGVDILEGDDLARLLDRAHSHRDLFTMLAFSGLRIGEALGLCWRDIDFDWGAGARAPPVDPIPGARAAQDRGQHA